jgi:hypothetical protein
MSFGTANRVRELRWMREWILIRSCDVGGKTVVNQISA